MIIADCGSGKPHCDSIIRLISPLAGLKPGFGVRQLAAAFLQASLLAGNRDPAERARASSLTRRAAACCRFSSGQPAGRKSRPCRKGASKLAPEESGSLLPLFFRPACWPEIETQPKGREQARSRGKRQQAAALQSACCRRARKTTLLSLRRELAFPHTKHIVFPCRRLGSGLARATTGGANSHETTNVHSECRGRSSYAHRHQAED